VHLQSNSVTSLAEEVAMHGNIKERETWRHIKGMLGRYWHMAKLRATQAETLSELIAQSPYPVLLAGDLNAVPQSYVYRRAGKGLKDTFRERGWGLGVTYVGYLPGLRIDYIFASGDFNVLDHRRGPRDFSDHRPVSSRLELAPP
jgi:endonuclease/exonuclease/phosphatase (EEP) superfamily protein YafD